MLVTASLSLDNTAMSDMECLNIEQLEATGQHDSPEVIGRHMLWHAFHDI